MFQLEMKSGKNWINVGDFDDLEDAKFCMFDAHYDYRVLDDQGATVASQKKTVLHHLLDRRAV